MESFDDVASRSETSLHIDTENTTLTGFHYVFYLHISVTNFTQNIIHFSCVILI